MASNNDRVALNLIMKQIEMLSTRLDSIDNKIDGRLIQIQNRLNYIDERLSKLEGKTALIGSVFGGFFGGLVSIFLKFLR